MLICISNTINEAALKYKRLGVQRVCSCGFPSHWYPSVRNAGGPLHAFGTIHSPSLVHATCSTGCHPAGHRLPKHHSLARKLRNRLLSVPVGNVGPVARSKPSSAFNIKGRASSQISHGSTPIALIDMYCHQCESSQDSREQVASSVFQMKLHRRNQTKPVAIRTRGFPGRVKEKLQWSPYRGDTIWKGSKHALGRCRLSTGCLEFHQFPSFSFFDMRHPGTKWADLVLKIPRSGELSVPATPRCYEMIFFNDQFPIEAIVAIREVAAAVQGRDCIERRRDSVYLTDDFINADALAVKVGEDDVQVLGIR